MYSKEINFFGFPRSLFKDLSCFLKINCNNIQFLLLEHAYIWLDPSPIWPHQYANCSVGLLNCLQVCRSNDLSFMPLSFCDLSFYLYLFVRFAQNEVAIKAQHLMNL